jgi:hypothetical protein
MSWKAWLAKKLCPEAFEDQRRWRHAYDLLYELKWWCHGHFPEASMGANWVLACVFRHFGDPDRRDCIGACTIEQFREDLRNLRRQEEEAEARPSRDKLIEALGFYARHEHWMSLSDDGPQRVLIAMKGKSSPEGWSVAEDCLEGRSEALRSFASP